MHRPTSRDSEVYLSPSIDHAEAIINSFASRSQAGSISTVSTAADPKIKLLDLTQQKRPPAQIYQESTIWGSPALRTIDCEKLAGLFFFLFFSQLANTNQISQARGLG